MGKLHVRTGVWALGLALLLGGTPVGQTLAAPSNSTRFAPSTKAVPAALPAYAKTGTGRIGALPADWLSKPRIEVTLPDGRTVAAIQQHVSRGPERISWSGKPTGDASGLVAVTSFKGQVTGTLQVNGEAYELRPGTNNDVVLYQVDAKLRPAGLSEPVIASYKLQGLAPTAKKSATGRLATKPGPAVFETVIMYTAAAKAHFGEGLESAVQNAVHIANTAYQVSGVSAAMDLRAIVPTAVNEGTGGMYDTLSAFAVAPDARQARDQYSADLVLLISGDEDYCGLAYLMTVPDVGFEPFAYGVVSQLCLQGATVLAHEAGHLQGLMHDRETESAYTDGAQPSRPYAYGYRSCRYAPYTPGARDIMSYPCTAGRADPKVQFSNPRRTIQGQPFGVDYESDPANAADAVRALNDNASIVAQFRPSLAALPSPPANLTLERVGVTVARLRWTEGPGEHSGTVIERAMDGGEWIEIAQYNEPGTGYDDFSLDADRTYSFRVRAYNGAGMTEPSNTVSMSTRIEPPLAPAGLQVTDNGDRSVTIQWVPVFYLDATYEVQRETWAKVRVPIQVGTKTKMKKVWQYAYPTRVGTLPGYMVSMVDMCGSGRFRYTVRAINSAGAGAYATPVTITVKKK